MGDNMARARISSLEERLLAAERRVKVLERDALRKAFADDTEGKLERLESMIISLQDGKKWRAD